MSVFQIRQMRADEVSHAVDLAAAEGWNPGLHDGECFYATDPAGFLVADLDGRMIGCVSAVSYDGRFGFGGFYIMLAEFRHRGYGQQLYRAVFERLRGHTIGIDGVVEQQENYRNGGFRSAHRNVRWEGRGRACGTWPAEIVAAGEIPMDVLCGFDRRYFPAERRGFLTAWLAMPQSVALAWREGETLRGYGVMRRCREGWKVGPLFAESATIADGLFVALAGGAGEGDPVYLDVPEPNGEAVALAARHGMRHVFETARMYAGEAPAIDLAGVYGITTFELG